MPSSSLPVELSAVIVAVMEGEPIIMTVPERALPSGAFGAQHRTLEQALRAWVKKQSGMELGYVEQLYTFADKDRSAEAERQISIGYLALVRAPQEEAQNLKPTPWYSLFPWEDRRQGVPQPVTNLIQKGLAAWKKAAPDRATQRARESRIAVSFPDDPRKWNEELVLQRYELLWEAGLIAESHRGRTDAATIPGLPMAQDHRRILATGIARLRAKIKYRPVVFELLPDRFTLLALQTTVEALAGLRLHKQNFRRLVQNEGLVEETNETTRPKAGRPAKLFAFRHEILRNRAAAGTKLPRS
jgi:hypothetical protein